MSTLTLGARHTAHIASAPASTGLLGLLAREWAYFTARLSMAHLNDEVLHDMGVGRSEIDDVVRHGRPTAR